MSLQHDFTPAEIAAKVNERYGSCAIDAEGRHTTAQPTTIAKAFGYTQAELTAIPDRANLGLSCGNPCALANLKEVCMRVCVAANLWTKVDDKAQISLGRSRRRFWQRGWFRRLHCGTQDRSQWDGHWGGYEPGPFQCAP